MSFGMNANRRLKTDESDDQGQQQQEKNKSTSSGFNFSEFRQQRLQSLAGMENERSTIHKASSFASSEEFTSKARERVSFSVPRMDLSVMGSESTYDTPPTSSERTESVRSNFGKVFDEEMLQLLKPSSSRAHSFESRSNRRRSLSNSSKNSSNANSPEGNSGVVDMQNVQNEVGLTSFLWKQSKEYLYVLVPLGEKGFYKQDENIELDVQIKSKRIYAAFNEKGSDIAHEILVDSEICVEVQTDESGWCIRNSHLLFELRKRDSSDDVQFPLQCPIRVKLLDEDDSTCKYEVIPSDAPLHKETLQDWFSCVEEDIAVYYTKFDLLKKEKGIGEVSDDDLDEAEELHDEALEHPDLDEAFNIYKEAADLGHAQSRFAFANLCLIEEDNPFKIKRSESMARQYLEMASLQNGYAKASFKAAMMYSKGTGVEKSYEMAKMFFIAAVIQEGDPKAMMQLGALYEEIANNKADDTIKQEKLQKAMAWYRLAINRGFSNACYSASLLMHKKKDKNKNFESSMAFFNLGRVFSSKLDDNAYLTKTTKEKLETIEDSDELIIPHWSPRKSTIKPKSAMNSARNSISVGRKKDPVDAMGFKPLEKFSLPNETQLLKKQIEKLQTEKFALEETVERMKLDYDRKVFSLNTEINNLKSELQKYKYEEKSRTEEMTSISKLRETLTQFQEQELRLAIHHALLSLKLRANTNLELPPLVDKAMDENISMNDLGSWFQSQCERFEGGG